MAYDSHDSYRPRSPALNRFIQTSPARVPSPALRLQSGLYVSHASSYSAGQRYQDGLFGVGSDPSGGVVYAPQPQPSRLSSAYDYPQKPRAQYGMTRPYNSPPIGSAQGWGAGVGHFELNPTETETYEQDELDDDEYYLDEYGSRRKKRPRTPPDMCGVCGVTQTPEWRKGPAGVRSLCNGCGLQAAKRAKERKERGYSEPSTNPEIATELANIGAERFKYPANAAYQLPPRTMERIQFTRERTQAQTDAHTANSARKGRRGSIASKGGSPTEGRSALPTINQGVGAGGERAAASALMGMARRGSLPSSSLSSAYAPRSPPSTASGPSSLRTRRGSASQPGGPVRTGRPPSSSLSSVTPLPSMRTASSQALPPMRKAPPASFFARSPSPGPPSLGGLRLYDSAKSNGTERVPLTRSRSPGPRQTTLPSLSKTFGVAPVPKQARPASPILRSGSPSMGRSNRMSLSHLTHPSAAPSSFAPSGMSIRRPGSPGLGSEMQRPPSGFGSPGLGLRR